MRSSPLVLFALSMLAAPSGCGERERAAPAEAAPADEPVVALGRDPVATDLSDAEVRGLLERWLAAQNGGDFAAYRALYANRMTGVKRVGERRTDYDRAGWLADRERMFDKPMTVAAEGVAIALAGNVATIRFEQAFATGRFKDVGDKQLVVIREAGAPRIAREEMLASRVEPAVARGARPLDLHFVLALGDARFVVLERGAAALADGAPTALDTRVPGLPVGGDARPARAVVSPVADARLAPLQRAFRGAELTVFGREGEACRARVARLAVLAGVTPHFASEARWADAADPLDPVDVAEQIRALAGADGAYLVGALEGDGCGDARWARRDLAPLVRFAPVDDAALRDGAIAAFRALPEWRALQAAAGGAGPWDGTPSTELVRHPDGGSTWAIVRGVQRDGGCAGSSGELGAVFEHDGGRWQRRSGESLRVVGEFVDTAVDLDGDRRPELLGPAMLLDDERPGGALDLGAALEFPFLDCPC